MSEALTRPGFDIIMRGPDGEAQGMICVNIPKGPTGILFKVSDRLYFAEYPFNGTYKEVTFGEAIGENRLKS